MAQGSPIWWMQRSCSVPPPKPEPAFASEAPPEKAPLTEPLAALTARFRQSDPETLLLLALLWLLWQEHADRKLILALAYIIW